MTIIEQLKHLVPAHAEHVLDSGEGWKIVRRETVGGHVTCKVELNADGTEKSRKLHCEDDYATVGQFTSKLMLDGVPACTVVFSGADGTLWTTRMMKVSEADTAIAKGKYGDDARKAPYLTKLHNDYPYIDESCLEALKAAGEHKVKGDVIACGFSFREGGAPVGASLEEALTTGCADNSSLG